MHVWPVMDWVISLRVLNYSEDFDVKQDAKSCTDGESIDKGCLYDRESLFLRCSGDDLVL